jgi:hypothetical protein
MATGAGGFTFDEKYEKNLLYQGGVTGFNPDIENTSGAYWEPAAELKWYKDANNILYKQKEELQLEIKVYKKIIKNLLKKK